MWREGGRGREGEREGEGRERGRGRGERGRERGKREREYMYTIQCHVIAIVFIIYRSSVSLIRVTSVLPVKAVLPFSRQRLLLVMTLGLGSRLTSGQQASHCKHCNLRTCNTVEPLFKGHLGTSNVVLSICMYMSCTCRKVSASWRLKIC